MSRRLVALLFLAAALGSTARAEDKPAVKAIRLNHNVHEFISHDRHRLTIQVRGDFTDPAGIGTLTVKSQDVDEPTPAKTVELKMSLAPVTREKFRRLFDVIEVPYPAVAEGTLYEVVAKDSPWRYRFFVLVSEKGPRLLTFVEEFGRCGVDWQTHPLTANREGPTGK
jgi:hypothetical protein